LDRKGFMSADYALADRLTILDSPLNNDWRRFHETVVQAVQIRRALAHIPTDIILTVGNYMSLQVPFVAPDRKSILSVHANLTHQLRTTGFPTIIGELCRWRYPRSLIISPSHGVADDLHDNFGVTQNKI